MDTPIVWKRFSERTSSSGKGYQFAYTAVCEGATLTAYNDAWTIWYDNMCLASGSATGVNTAKKAAEAWLASFSAFRKYKDLLEHEI